MNIEYDIKSSESWSPVIYLKDNIPLWIKTYYPRAYKRNELLIKKGCLKKIIIIPDKTPFSQKPTGVFTKRIETDLSIGTIYINEVYLSYLWLCCCSIYINWYEIIHKPLENGYYGLNIFKINPRAEELVQLGLNHFKLASTFLTSTPTWPDYFLSPSIQNGLIAEDYHGISNGIFLASISFQILHEIGHIEKNHGFARYLAFGSKNKYAELSQLEYKADDYAIRKVGSKRSSETTVFGVIISLCCDLFFYKNTNRQEHPDILERIEKTLKRIISDNNSELYAITCIALRLWDITYSHNFNWDENVGDTYKNLISGIAWQ